MAALLEVNGLKAYYGQTQALHDVSFSLAEGGITTLLGANGAGKTTTLRALCGLVRRDGAVTLAGKSITGMATEDIVRLGVAHVPEGRGTFVGLSVEENLRIAAYTRRDKPAVARAVTLEVTVQQAQSVILAQGIGRLSLVLRQTGRREHHDGDREGENCGKP